MVGRVKRKAGLAAAAQRVERVEPLSCALCGRRLGMRVEWHHPVRHRTIHATLSNAELARGYSDFALLRAHPDMARFLRWIAGKPADFHAPTRGAR
jgi:hypothetical protein